MRRPAVQAGNAAPPNSVAAILADVTQILGGLRYPYLFQVSDRRLSWSTPGLPVADHRSNKSLIVKTVREIALVGYSGIASLGDLPTDDWLAGSICAAGRATWAEPNHHNDLGRISIGEVVTSLCRHVEKEQQAQRRGSRARFDFGVQIVGFRVRRKRFQPFVFRLEWHGERPVVVMHDRPILEAYRTGLVLMTPVRSREIRAAVTRELRFGSGPADFMNCMASAMTEVSLAAPGVGNDLLGIALHVPTLRGNLSYRSGAPDTFRIADGKLPLFRIPWVLGPGQAAQPADVGGNGELVFPQLPLVLRLPEVREPPSTMSLHRWRADRSYNPSKASVCYERPTTTATMELSPGKHEMVARFHGRAYRRP